MNLLNIFRKSKPSSAQTAKERLQIIISHERAERNTPPDLLSKIKEDLIAVIAKYFRVDMDQLREQITVDMEKRGEQSVLELNIALPDVEDALLTEDTI
jgi:cell division topological specificity factor